MLQEATALRSQVEGSLYPCSSKRQQIAFCRVGRCLTLNKQPLRTKHLQDPFSFLCSCMRLQSW